MGLSTCGGRGADCSIGGCCPAISVAKRAGSKGKLRIARAEKRASCLAAFVSGVEDKPESSDLAGIPIGWNRLIEKNTRQLNMLEHVLVGKVDPLFRDML
jgi:hypothetical protein